MGAIGLFGGGVLGSSVEGAGRLVAYLCLNCRLVMCCGMCFSAIFDYFFWLVFFVWGRIFIVSFGSLGSELRILLYGKVFG